MKTAKAFLVAALAGLTLLAASAPAEAHRYSRGHYYGGPRVTFGFYGGPYWWGPGYWGAGYWGPRYWGPGYWGSGYWGSSYYYAPPAVVVPSEPRVYVERDPAPEATSGQQWWYWCQSAKSYYPYVSTCSEGWQRVAPQPPQAPR